MQASFFCANGYLSREAPVFRSRQNSRWLQPAEHSEQEENNGRCNAERGGIDCDLY